MPISEWDSLMCIKCKVRLNNLFYRIGTNGIQQVRHVGKVCPKCKRYKIVDKRYVEGLNA